MAERGITAIGTFIPRMRLERSAIYAAHDWALPGLKGKARGQLSVSAWDQDVITMGVEAARASLYMQTKQSVSRLRFASTSHPFIDRSAATLAANALGLPSSVFATDLAASRRSGTSALIQGLVQHEEECELLVAAENRVSQPGSWAEIGWGDGAAACIIDNGDPVAVLAGWHSVHEDFVDFYWAQGYQPYQGEERWIKDTVLNNQVIPVARQAISNSGLEPGDIRWAVLPEPVPGCEKLILQGLEAINATAVTGPLMADTGDTGTALPLLGLACAMERAESGDHILVMGFGNGCDALVLKMLRPLPASSRNTQAQIRDRKPIGYTQFATTRGKLDLDFGPRAERVEKTSLSVHERVRRDYTPFIGGRTNPDGPVQFPKSPIATDQTFVGEAGYTDVRLADLEGKVVSITKDNLVYSPEPPFHFGLVEFDNGARLPVEFADVPEQGLQSGDPVRMAFRIKSIDRERGYRHYFWKAVPAQTRGES